MKLWIKNEKEEFIAHVKFDVPIIDVLNESPVCEKLVIKDFDKDLSKLRQNVDKSNSHIKMSGVSAEDDKKLEGFSKYLSGRQKAGIIKHFGLPIYLLPSAAGQPSMPMTCICPVKLLKDYIPPSTSSVSSTSTGSSTAHNNGESLSTTNVASSNAPHVSDDDVSPSVYTAKSESAVVVDKEKNNTSTADSTTDVKPPATAVTSTTSTTAMASASSSATVKPKAAIPASSPFNFLSSLANQIAATNVIRASTSKLASADNAVKSYLEQLETRLKKEVLRFETDSTHMEIHLEPMNKDMRTCVHNIITEYPDLQSVSTGDFEDRHVVIFRVGHEPVGVELNTRAIVIPRGQAIKTTTTRTTHHHPHEPASVAEMGNKEFASSLIKVDQVKRDRRTTEEVQEEMRKRKRMEEEASAAAQH